MSTLINPHIPSFAEHELLDWLATSYGLAGNLAPLAGERDRNFRLTTPNNESFVVKVALPAEHDAMEMQAALLDHAAFVDPTLPLPRQIRDRDGRALVRVASEGRDYRLRVVSWIDGTPLGESTRTEQQLVAIGVACGRLSRALQGFGHRGAFRPLEWDIARSADARSRLHHVAEGPNRDLLRRAVQQFEERVRPRLTSLRHSVVHGDLNDWNILVARDDPSRIAGLIDLGDSVFSVTAGDLAILCAYTAMNSAAPLLAIGHVVRGYQSAFPLLDEELAVLLDLVRARLCMSLTMSAARRATSGEAANPYWYVSEEGAWRLLRALDVASNSHATPFLRQASGLEPSPSARRATEWIWSHRKTLAPVFAEPLERIPLYRIDWTDPNDAMVRATVAGDLAAADHAYAEMERTHHFEAAVGGYGETRAVYAADAFASRLIAGARRNMHLGVDLFAPAHHEVHTPLEARVVAAIDCQSPQDYGGVVLLEHALPNGASIKSLWGHLAPRSIASLKPGQTLPKGAVVGRLGDSSENGGWVPHLHLQLVGTDELVPADIIGVGESAFRSLWEAIYPDASTFAGVPNELRSPHTSNPEHLRQRRKKSLGPNLSLSYKEPLHIVRGDDVWLYDARGRAYLDCYNNVAHVGHARPEVVEAIARQAAQLNTNTRYLHERVIEYAERLTALMPSPLRVCYFTCSGSEANELALRLARAYTKRREIAVLDWAYHGSTTTLVEISPYKYKRGAEQGRGAYVYECPVPDSYRAPDDWPTNELGARYALQLSTALQDAPHGTSLIAETIPSCAGQLVLPHGFLTDAFAFIRSRGGLCLLDEVQVGFGRVGNSYWAFTEHGVTPDVVTFGKPIGNGQPMGAVVTTPEVAEAFAKGPEYFNTFGGNPVSAAAGIAVLDVLEKDGLLQNASERGQEIYRGLRELAQADEGIGEVRGRGLFLGLDLVADRLTKAPDTNRAREVVNRCKEAGVLLGTDGPADNVIKIRPPMTVGREHVDQLIQTLGEALTGSRKA